MYKRCIASLLSQLAQKSTAGWIEKRPNPSHVGAMTITKFETLRKPPSLYSTHFLLADMTGSLGHP